MFANHMPDGINFQGPEGNLYKFCQKKEKKWPQACLLKETKQNKKDVAGPAILSSQ